MPHLLTGAEAAAILLERSPAKSAFAYPGTSELSLCDAVLARGAIALVNARGDKEAVFMAAGASLGSPGLGIAIVHGARGLTNAMGAVADSRRSELSFLCIVGLASTGSSRYLPPHAEAGLLQATSTFARATFDTTPIAETWSERDFVSMLASAIRQVGVDPGGPVILGLPQDVAQKRFVSREVLDEFQLSIPASPSTTLSDPIYRAQELLRTSKRPLFLVDDYLMNNVDGEAALGLLTNKLRAPVMQVRYARGPMLFQECDKSLVPNFIGRLDRSDPVHAEVLAEADLLVTVEDRNMYPRVVGDLPSIPKIAVTSNPEATIKNGYLTSSDLTLAGDAASTLYALAQAFSTRDEPSSSWVPNQASPGDWSDLDANARRIAGIVGTALSDCDVLIDDSQMFGGLLAAHYDLLPRRLRIAGGHGGFVGSGLAIAVGLAAAQPNLQVACTLGDQAFTNATGALSVAGQSKAGNLRIIVANNGGSVSLRKQSGADGLGSHLHEWLTNNGELDYVDLARAYGVAAHRVESSDLLAASAEGLNEDNGLRIRPAGRTFLVELVLPNEPTFWRGIWSTTGKEESFEAPAVAAGIK